MANNIKALRLKAGLTQPELAERMGTTKNQLIKLEKGHRRLTLEWIERVSEALGVEDEDVVSNQVASVPLVGYVGAGAVAHYYAAADDPDELVEAPEGSTAKTVAVEIRGDSLGELFDRWLVYYDDVKSPVTPDLIGHLCVVGLFDDSVLVKKIKASRSPGFYHLLSNNEAPILDAEIAWAAKVKTMTPR